MARRGISFVICYISFNTRIRFKMDVKRGAHLLAPGPDNVKGEFVREFMLLLDAIRVVEQSTQERDSSPL